MTSLRVEIERLRLHGFDGPSRERVLASLHAELGRLVEASGVPERFSSGHRLERLDALSLSDVEGGDEHAVGTRLARRIFDHVVAPANERRPQRSGPPQGSSEATR